MLGPDWSQSFLHMHTLYLYRRTGLDATLFCLFIARTIAAFMLDAARNSGFSALPLGPLTPAAPLHGGTGGTLFFWFSFPPGRVPIRLLTMAPLEPASHNRVRVMGRRPSYGHVVFKYPSQADAEARGRCRSGSRLRVHSAPSFQPFRP